MKDENLIDRQLALAWQGLTPPSGLQERLRARLEHLPPPAPNAPPRGAVNGSGLRMLRASGKVGLAAGTGIFVLGFLAGRLAPTAASAPPELAAAEQVAAVRVEQSGAPTEIDDAMTAPRQELAPSAAPDLLLLPKSTKPRAVPVARGAPRATGSARDWRAELELLERAERALRADNVALALALLAEFDARHPRSALREERAAIEVMAQCRAGSTDGSARAERFLRAHGHSVYAARIRELCEPKSTSSSSVEPLTNPRGSGHEAR